MAIHWSSRVRALREMWATAFTTHGHFYFVPRPKKCEKNRSKKSLLNPHFKGFGAITRSGFCWSCFSDHFGMVDVPFRPMNDHFVTILVFFAIFVGRRVPFFGHSLLSYSKRRHLSTSRVILWPLSYHPFHSLSYDDIIRYRIGMPIDVGGKWRPHGGPILGS